MCVCVCVGVWVSWVSWFVINWDISLFNFFRLCSPVPLTLRVLSTRVFCGCRYFQVGSLGIRGHWDVGSLSQQIWYDVWCVVCVSSWFSTVWQVVLTVVWKSSSHVWKLSHIRSWSGHENTILMNTERDHTYKSELVMIIEQDKWQIEFVRNPERVQVHLGVFIKLDKIMEWQGLRRFSGVCLSLQVDSDHDLIESFFDTRSSKVLCIVRFVSLFRGSCQLSVTTTPCFALKMMLTGYDKKLIWNSYTSMIIHCSRSTILVIFTGDVQVIFLKLIRLCHGICGYFPSVFVCGGPMCICMYHT